MIEPSNSLSTIIRQRRKSLGATVPQSAAWAELSPERWSQIEKGQAFQAAELGSIAHALAADPGAVLRGELNNPRRSTARFRSSSPTSIAPSDLRTLSIAAELGRIGGSLLRLLDRPIELSSHRDPRPIDDVDEPWRAGYLLGEQARRRLGVAAGPIEDVEATVSDIGVHIAHASFSDNSIEAASLWEDGALPIILLNQRARRINNVLSRRAAIAHEVCHLLHDSGEYDLSTAISRAEEFEGSQVEQRARAFAPAFLAPRDEVSHYFRTGKGRRVKRAESQVLKIAEHWGLSFSGAAWHAKNCRLITSGKAEQLANQTAAGQAWEHNFEQVSERADRPLVGGLLSDLVADAASAGVISASRADEILAWGG